MDVIEPAAWRAQPWRNGAGVTHELMRWPPFDPFAVRISVAEITAPAPFSAFPGYRRWLYLLEGGPVTLAVGRAEVVLAGPADGLAFAGDASVAATAVARPSRDLNVMVSDALPERVELVRGPGRRELAGAVVAVFAIAGAATVAGERGGPRALGRHECAWATGGVLALELGPGAVAAVLAA